MQAANQRLKPLVPWNDRTLIEAVAARLKPQVDQLWLSVGPEPSQCAADTWWCNQQHSALDLYRELGFPIVFDRADLYNQDPNPWAGPLVGILSALERCPGQFLLVVPCDSPDIPLNLKEKLLAPLLRDPSLAVSYAVDARGRAQPLHCCIRVTAGPELSDLYEVGERSALRMWESLADRAVCVALDHCLINLNQ